MTIFLPHSRIWWRELALAFGERAVRGGDEQDQVGARHEAPRQQLVLARDRVGAGRIDQVDVAKQRRARGDRAHVGVSRPFALIDVSQDLHLGGRRRDALGQDALAEQRVDHGALARVELSDDHQQEEVLELLKRRLQRLLVLAFGGGPHERGVQIVQGGADVADRFVLLRAQDAARFGHGRSSGVPTILSHPIQPFSTNRSAVLS